MAMSGNLIGSISICSLTATLDGMPTISLVYASVPPSRSLASVDRPAASLHERSESRLTANNENGLLGPDRAGPGRSLERAHDDDDDDGEKYTLRACSE